MEPAPHEHRPLDSRSGPLAWQFAIASFRGISVRIPSGPGRVASNEPATMCAGVIPASEHCPRRPLDPAPMPAPSRRSLLPHEHGAYGQVALPLVCALALGRPGMAAALLAAGAFAGFLSYEPLLVAVGNRGQRARDEDGPRARRLAAGLLAAAVALAGAGFLLSPPPARLASAVPPALAAAIALLVRLELERT